MITLEEILERKDNATKWATPVVVMYKGHYKPNSHIAKNGIDRLNGNLQDQLVYHDEYTLNAHKNFQPNSDWVENLMGLNLHDTLIEKEWLE